eukprot:SAG11_NODE_3033_length_2749_cov_4.883774_2_plen_57_part_00
MENAHLATQTCAPDAAHSRLGIRGDDDLEGLIKSQLTLPSVDCGVRAYKRTVIPID